LVLALDVAWQSALIFLSGELAARVLRRPGARYAMWMAALAGTVVTPMATGWLRSLEVTNPVLHTGAPVAVEVLDTGARTDPIPIRGTAPGPPTKPSVYAMAWAAGVLVLSLSALGGYLAAVRARRRSHPVEDPRVLRVFEEERGRFGLGSVGLMISEDVSCPAVVGYLRPVVLLPSGVAGDEREVRWAIRHELAHLKRRDNWAILFQRAVGALLFFDPLVWLINRRLDVERELACDSLVLEDPSERTAYARFLVSQLESFPRRSGIVGALRSRSRLFRRIRGLLYGDLRPGAPPLGAAALSVLFPCVLLGTVLLGTDPGPSPVWKGPVLWTGGSDYISGTVVDRRGRPASGASVSVRIAFLADGRVSPGGGPSVRTDGEGRYRLWGLRRGIYNLEVRHRRLGWAVLTGVHTGAEDADAVLGARGKIWGTVRDVGGRPIEGAEVSLELVEDPDTWTRRPYRALTGPDGRFVLDIPLRERNSRLTVSVGAEGYVARKAEVEVGWGKREAEIEIVLRPGARAVEGTVLDPSGRQVPGAVVGVDDPELPLSLRGPLSVRTDRRGRYRLYGLPEGRYTIVASKPGYAPGAAFEVEAGGQAPPIVLGRGGSVAGRVVDGSGRGLSGVSVALGHEECPEFHWQVFAGKDGRYRFENLPEGTYEVRVLPQISIVPHRFEGIRASSRRVEVRSGTEARVDFVLVRGQASTIGGGSGAETRR